MDYKDLYDECIHQACNVLSSGSALGKFREIVLAQNGDPLVVDDSGRLPRARYTGEVYSPVDGFVEAIDCAAVGTASATLGAGRERKEDVIDPADSQEDWGFCGTRRTAGSFAYE